MNEAAASRQADQEPAPLPGDDDPLIQTRRAKLQRLRDAGAAAFPARTGRTHSLQQALTILGSSKPRTSG